MWERENGRKAMLIHVRTFHNDMLESYKASLVMGPATNKRKTAGMLVELNKHWTDKG